MAMSQHSASRPFLGPQIVGVACLTLMGAFGLNLTGGQFFAPLSAAYGWSLPTLSLAVAINAIVWGLFQPVMGTLIDRFGPKPVIASSTALMGIAFLLSAGLNQLYQFFFYYGVLAAIGFAGCSSLANSVLVSKWYSRRRGVMLARSSLGINFGQLALLPLTGWLIDYANFRVAFAVLGSIMLLGVVPAVLFWVRDDPEAAGQRPDGNLSPPSERAQSKPQAAKVDPSQVLQNKDFWLTTIGFVSCGYSLYLVTMHLPKHAIDLGGGAALGGQLLGIAAAASAVSMWTTGQLARSYQKRTILVPLYLIRAAAFAWLALAPGIGALYLFAIVYGLSSFPVIPMVTGIVGSRFGISKMGLVLGSAWLLHQVFAALGIFLGGFLRSATGDYTLAFWSCAAILTLGGIVTFFVDEKPRQTVRV